MDSNDNSAARAWPPQGRDALRHALLALHKAMVDEERSAYERVHGRVQASEFLNLLVTGESFAWLRPLTALIVQLDELMDAREGAQPGDAGAFRAQLTRLLQADPEGDDFQRHYAALLQSSPSVALAHGALRVHR